MLQKIKDNILYILGAVVAVLAFFWKREKDIEQEAKLQTAETDKKDAVLEEKQHAVQEHISEVEKQAEEEKQKKLSTKEMEDFLKKL